MEEKNKSKIDVNSPSYNPNDAYVSYPDSDDIYNNSTKITDVNPDAISGNISLSKKEEISLNKEKYYDESCVDLDVPGAELDDAMEKIGSEDEENNYYSIGGDEHNDLDEDKSE